MALGNEEGEKFINIASNYVSSSILKMSDILIKAATETVYMCTEKIYITKLDNIVGKYLKINNNIFLKIDAQGYELQVIEGASKILPKIKGMQIELSLVHLYEGQSLYHNMLDYIINLGFELYDILPVFSDKKKWKASAI